MYKPTHGGKPSFGGKSGGKRFGGPRTGGGGFGGKKFGGKSSFGGDRDRSAPELYDAVCAECRNKCQVPFRPNGKKPVLCRDCFGGGEGGDKKPFRRDVRPMSAPADRAPAMEARLLKEINAKLDAVLAALHA
jgi:CxxC-x17-CxxC domain-containing protein